MRNFPKRSTKKVEKKASNFFNYLKARIKNDNNIWEYIKECYQDFKVYKPNKLKLPRLEEDCNDVLCPNVHLWINKHFDRPTYEISFNFRLIWDKPYYCDFPKELCLKETGIVKEITQKLELPNEKAIDISEELFKIITKGIKNSDLLF